MSVWEKKRFIMLLFSLLPFNIFVVMLTFSLKYLFSHHLSLVIESNIRSSLFLPKIYKRLIVEVIVKNCCGKKWWVHFPLHFILMLKPYIHEIQFHIQSTFWIINLNLIWRSFAKNPQWLCTHIFFFYSIASCIIWTTLSWLGYLRESQRSLWLNFLGKSSEAAGFNTDCVKPI